VSEPRFSVVRSGDYSQQGGLVRRHSEFFPASRYGPGKVPVQTGFKFNAPLKENASSRPNFSLKSSFGALRQAQQLPRVDENKG